MYPRANDIGFVMSMARILGAGYSFGLPKSCMHCRKLLYYNSKWLGHKIGCRIVQGYGA